MPNFLKKIPIVHFTYLSRFYMPILGITLITFGFKSKKIMRNLFITGAVMFGLFLTACSAEVTTENGEVAVENGETESTSMTCEELEAQAGDLEGKEITIKAISWGNSNSIDGDVSMNLGDNKLEGMRQAHVVANFSPESADAAKAIKQDAEVTIKATVGKVDYGAVQLNNPEIVK